MAPIPGTEWIYNSRTGAVDQVQTPQAEVLLRLGIGWHGPFGSKQEALDYYTRNAPHNPGWKAPTGIAGNLGNAGAAVAEPAREAINSATSAWTAAINTAVKLVPRILEATVGIVLLAVAANAILKSATGVDVAGTAARGVKRAGRAVPVAGAVL
jgi:hypothetical protein